MSDYYGSKGPKLYGMTKEERLIYNTRTGQSNLIEWNKKMCLFMEAVFGAKASPIFRERMLPRCMLSDTYVPSPGLPDEDDQSAVAIKARELDYSEWRQERKEFITSRAQMVSTYLTGTLSQSSLDRVKDTRETDMEEAIRESDILAVHKIVWDSHQYRGKTFKVADQQRVLREFTMFNYGDGESLPSFKRRLMELLERMKNYDVSPTPFQIMYAFLMGAARFANNHVQDICIDYLALVDDETRFPLDLNSVYEELITKADVVSQVANRHRVRQSHEGSVHQTALRDHIRSQSNQRTKGNNKGFRPKGQVNSAFSNINKSVKKKLESHTMSGKPKNVHTDAYCQDWISKNPGKTIRDCLNSLPPCNNCRRRWHLEKDCRKSNVNTKSGPSNNTGPKKTFRKKFVKKGRVNNIVGNNPGFFDDPDADWIGNVFCMSASPMPNPTIDEYVSELFLQDSRCNTTEVLESIKCIPCGPIKSYNIPISSIEAELRAMGALDENAVLASFLESLTDVEVMELMLPDELPDFNEDFEGCSESKVYEDSNKLVFGSDEEIDAYLESRSSFSNSSCSHYTYEEISAELDRVVAESTEISYLYSEPAEYSDVSDDDEPSYVVPIITNLADSADDVDPDMPDLISNSDSSSGAEHPVDQPNVPDEDGGDDGSSHNSSNSSESSESSESMNIDAESVESCPVIVPGEFDFVHSSTISSNEFHPIPYDLQDLHAPEYFAGVLPRLAYGVRVDEEFHGWIDMVMYLTGRIPVRPFYFDEVLASELSRNLDYTTSSKYSGLYVETNTRHDERIIHLGMNVYKFIYKMYKHGLDRISVVKQLCESMVFRRRLVNGDEKVQFDINELNTEWKLFDISLSARVLSLQGFIDTTFAVPKSIPSKIWDYLSIKERANVLVHKFNLHPNKTISNWNITICNIVSAALQAIDHSQYKKKSHRCVITFGAIVRLTRRSGQDDKKGYGICKQKVNTINGISHVVGNLRVIRDAVRRKLCDCKVGLDDRKGVTLECVHAVSISREQDDQDGCVVDQSNIVILELSEDALDIPNVGRYPHSDKEVIAKEDWNYFELSDDLQVSFYRSEMCGVVRGQLSNVYTQYKAEILIACHQFYVTYVVEIDERLPCNLETIDGRDTRDEWYILQAVVHRMEGLGGSAAFRELHNMNVPDLVDVVERDVEGVPGRNMTIVQKGNNVVTSIPGFTRFVCILDSEGYPHWYYTQKVKGRIKVKSEPRIYYAKYDDSVSHHCLIYHQHFNDSFQTPLDAQVFMANYIQPTNSQKRTKIELMRDLEYLDLPDPELPRHLLVAGAMYMRYDPEEPIYLYDRVFIVPKDAQHWRQIKVAMCYDRSRRGLANELRVAEAFRRHFAVHQRDLRYIEDDINIHIRYDLPDDHEPYRDYVAGVTSHINVRGPSHISFVRDHVQTGKDQRDFYYRQLPNLAVRMAGGYNDEVEHVYQTIHELRDAHENAMMNSYLSYREYLLRYGRIIVNGQGCPPITLMGPAMEYDENFEHPEPHPDDLDDVTIDDLETDLRADGIVDAFDRAARGTPGEFKAGSETFKDDDNDDQGPPPSSGAVACDSSPPVASLEIIEECLNELLEGIPDPMLILGGPTSPGSHPFDATETENSSERISRWMKSQEMLAWKRERESRYIIPDLFSNGTVLDPAQSAAYMARGNVRAERSNSKYNNHTCIAIDTMANVSVFRNADLVPGVKHVSQGMNIEGVGEIGTKTQSKGIHPLFGEIWILPTNTYNILSQYQAKRNGFLMQFSEDNDTCWLVNKEKNISLLFERDPADHFLKCVMSIDGSESKVYSFTAIENKSRVFLMDKQSMYYTQEQLRKAEIVESMHVALEHPSDQQLTALIMSPSTLNMPVTVQDLHNLRAIKGPCNVCLEGRPLPHTGTHSGKDQESEATHPGEELHCDIVFVQRLPRLFTVCHVTGYMTFTLMTSKFAQDVLDAFDTVINAYKSYLKVVRYISCDHESVLKSIESELNKRGVRMRIRLPYEHEKRAERAMRVVRERMRVKIRELPYKLPKKLYDALAAECIRNINLMPNYKSLPHSPIELVKGDKVNYLTDISPAFGSLVLCPTYGEKQKSGSETKQEIAIALGPTGSNMKGGVLVYIPGREKPVVRRNVKSLAMTNNMIEHMNKWAESLPGFEGSEFVFRDTIASEASRGEDFNQDVDFSSVVASSPDNTQFNQLIEQEYVDGGVSGETYESSWDQSEMSATPTELSPTLVDISYRVDNSRNDSVVNNNMNEPASVASSNNDFTAPSPKKIAKSPAMEHVKRKYGREQHLDPSAIIGSSEKRTTRSKGDTPKVYQMSLKKAIASAAGDAAVEAAKKELKQLVDLKTWVYKKSRSDATKSVHTRVTPCSMFLKEKFNSRGEFLLWKARLVDGGHRTDPTKYNPFEKSSPTTSLEIVYTLLSMSVTEAMDVESFDVPGAYLNAELQPGRFHLMSIDKSIAKLLVLVDPNAREFVQQDGSILVEIRRSLYGLPEASKLWYDYFSKALTVGGYSICPHDPCLFMRKKGSEVSIIALYVDDCLHIWKGANIYRDLYASLRNAKLPDLKVDKLEGSKPISFLGLNITRNSDRTLSVNQLGYIKNLLETDGGYKSFPATPCTDQLFKLTDVVENDTAEPTESTPFASLLMKTRYCERTRPDLCLPLAVLQTKMRNPNENDEHLLERCIAYLEGTQERSMIIRKCDMKVYAYMDAAFAVHGNRVSHSGILFSLGKYGNSILCKSIKQKTVATSSTEAELICIFDGLDYLLWIRNVLNYLGYPQGTSTIYQDNTSTITMAYMGRGSSGSRTRHIDIKYFHIKQFLDSKDLEIDHLGRDNMTADFLASPRQGNVFRRFRGMIMGEIQ